MTTDKHNKRPNVPPLRFPEFTGDWRKLTIDDICSEFQSGKFIRADMIQKQGTIPVYGGNGLRGYTDTYNHVGDYVLIGRQGALCGNVRFVTDKTYITEHAIAVKGTNDNNTKFLQYLFEKKNLGQYSDQSAQPGLAVNKLLKLKISIPYKNEQQKIAKLLHILDERITTQSELIEDLQKLKAALVERLFCNKLGWKRYKYRDLLSPISERNSGNQFSNVLSASQELGMVSRTDLDIDIKFDRSAVTTYKIVRDGDYVLHLRSFQGGLAFSSMTGICSPAYTILRPVKELEYGFFQEYFMSKSFINSLRLVTYGIRDGRSINVDEFLDMPVEIPDSATQCRIISILSIMNRRLRLAIKQKENYIKQKQYLLQQMFI